MWNKILSVLAMVGTFFGAIYFVLFKQAKMEQNLDEAELEKERREKESYLKNLEAIQAGEEAVREERKANEELIEKAKSGNNLDAFNAINDLLSK